MGFGPSQMEGCHRENFMLQAPAVGEEEIYRIHPPLSRDVGHPCLKERIKNDGLATESEPAPKDMTAVNAGVHELSGVRLPLQPYSGGHAVFMYSTAADGNVTLQLKEPDDLDRGSLAAMLARLQDDATFSISYQDTDILSDGSIDVLLGTGSNNSLQTPDGNDAVTATFDLFDSSSGPDLTLSPQTFTNSAEAFINDNSNSLGVPTENDPVSSTDDTKKVQTEVVKLAVKRARPKAASPNRQGPQQCQVCAKVFGNASALAKHKLTHSDERKYVCTMCGKAFKRQDHLNGHMLTHRNKKPYECKAEGCGKSYCDARSLRRHTENHHSSSTTSANASTTTMSPAQGAASGDAASPHGSSCIQYAPPPTSNTATGKSQLQQLLATEPTKGGSSGNNDGLTKQQLDLIHQIMEQTQRQSQTALKSTAKQPTKPVSKTAIKVQRVWSSQQSSSTKGSISIPSSQTKASSSTPTVSTSGSTSSSTSSTSTSQSGNKAEPKPVECNLCHRKFKNIPALNGHMRLHGGYFKKDADNKKCEKKDTTGPPLQTASVSVRALIEEKIINKRITNTPTAPVTTTSIQNEEVTRSTTAPPLFPLTVHSTTTNTSGDLDTNITSFAVPAVPPQQLSSEKSRRHSDAEAFTIPRAPNGSTTQQEAEALADLILKHEKATVKRTVSDPGQQSSQTSPQQQQQQQQQQQKASSQIIQFQSGSDSFTLAYQSEDGGYLSPTLQDEVFTQVPDSMLLQGVDAQQLASIQFQTDSLLQDQSDHQLLDDYTNLQDTVIQSPSYQSSHSVNQELQAVLDSPLPESLAEFSTYHSTGNLDMSSPTYQTQSPVQYSSQSPHATLATRSPLQSPLIRHDSPGFAYPTPPASHEGLSPCFGQNSMLPMVSPKQSEFGQMVSHDMDDPPQPSSPLTAAFFTSTMSSAAAVEEALEEVLPGENISADELYPSLTNSPPPPASAHSPLPIGLTPIASPLSTVVTSSTATSSTHATFTQNTVTFPMSTHFTLQSQMMPNSDDPLLSSSPKDFIPRKKFEFNGLPLKVISSNGLLDLNNSNLTGILVESNGEIKFIQTGGTNFQAKNIIVAGTPLLTTTTPKMKDESNGHPKNILVQKISKTKAITLKTRDIKLEDLTNDVFLSPTTLVTNQGRLPRKRPRIDPLQLPVLHQSRLRATRSKPQGSAPYTAQPILNPNRAGSGLYVNIKQKINDQDEASNIWSNESVPESDSTPHINIGPKFQCSIPVAMPSYHKFTQDRAPEDLLWDPGISSKCSNSEVDMYLDFACCAAVPGGGRNHEYAMHLLHMCDGNIHEAMLKLMQPTPSLPNGHPLLSYHYTESDKWTVEETEQFHQALLKHDKDFYLISQEVGSKTLKQCLQFYYMWKKVCTEDYKRYKQNHERTAGLRNSEFEEKPYPDAKLLGIADAGSPMPVHEHRNYICEFSDCSASFNSRAALNGHIRIHGGTARNSPTPSQYVHQHNSHATADITSMSSTGSLHQLLGKRSLNTNGTQSVQSCHNADPTEDYPCKICGKVFTKIKSRSAHMKSHRPPDAEVLRQKQQKDKEQNLSSTVTTVVTVGAHVTTSQTFDSVPTSYNT